MGFTIPLCLKGKGSKKKKKSFWFKKEISQIVIPFRKQISTNEEKYYDN